jgi:membrane-associated protease RseP (regulator of RpoE activity)
VDSDQREELLHERINRWLGPQKLWLHILLFIVTYFTTTVAGVHWRLPDPNDWFDLSNLSYGFTYATCVMLFISSHEFGHFIAARIHGVDATLPYYIPYPPSYSISFGTLGALIRTRSRVPSNKVMFDIGVAGPIAGFIICLILLAIGFATLPGIEYLQQIHPGYPDIPHGHGGDLIFGKTLLWTAMEKIFANHGYLPPMSEVYHYPLLCAGWFGLFVTALNLLPVGQLDGGHLTYTLFGRNIHRRLGQITAVLLFAISLPDVIISYFDSAPSWLQSLAIPGGQMWFLWALITTFVIRFRHPPTEDESPLDPRRKLIAYLTIGILIVSFTPTPLVFR